MSKPLQELKQIRLKKLGRIRQMGINPFPADWPDLDDRNKIAACQEQPLGASTVVAGRITAWREHGKLIFADLRDETGQIQVCFKQDNLSKEDFNFLELLDLGDFLGIRGELFETGTKELTILVDKFKLLSKSLRPLPSEWYGLQDQEVRYRQRYVDLILNPEVKKVFLIRSQAVTELRRILNEHGFVEVETPILQPVYGGASAKPFTTHHNALDTDFYLRISDELYLKRLITGGFEKVYEISKDFRNEGIDRQHNPEFTMLEFYWAYADYQDLMVFTEKMLSTVMLKTVGSTTVDYQGKKLDFTPPLPRVKFYELVKEKTGIDLEEANDEDRLLEEINARSIRLDLEGVVGFGALADKLYKETCRPQIEQPTFLTDYPTETMPLAKRKEEEPHKIANFQLLVEGFEVIKAYNELNDPLDQKSRWQEMENLGERGLEEHEVVDEDYIRALEYGMPPTAGWGMGIDRFVALITNQPSLKDVILFPTLRPEKL